MQSAIIVVLLLVSAFYLGRLIYLSLASNSCANGCGKCGVIDAEKIIKRIKDKEISLT
jgi:hypothetical protein